MAERGGLGNTAKEYPCNLPQLHSEVLLLLSLVSAQLCCHCFAVRSYKLFCLKYINGKQVAVDLLSHNINFLGLNGCCLETKQLLQEYLVTVALAQNRVL